jgi:Domain of unknown function (DUF4047)
LIQGEYQMRKTFHQHITFVCLCCLFFCLGNYLVGETEAKFSSQDKAQSLELSTAFVFPETIKHLEDTAEEIVMSMKKNYQMTLSNTPDESLGELEVQLSKIKANVQELYIQMDNLNTVYEELSLYKNKNQQDTLTYVHEGFQSVESLRNEVLATIDFSKVEAVHSLLEFKIKELEKMTKQVIENDEEVLEGSA